MKTSFVLYTEYMSFFEALTLEEKGMLLEAIFAYEAGMELPEMDSAVKVAFSFIKKRLDINDEKYEKKAAASIENGKKGGRPKKTEKTQDNPVGFLETQDNPVGFLKPNETQKNHVYVNDNVNDLSKDKVSSLVINNIPTLTELTNYISDKKLNVNAQRFHDYYTIKGWDKITDWKAAVEFWSKNERRTSKTSQFCQTQKSDYDVSEIEKALLAKQRKEIESG